MKRTLSLVLALALLTGCADDPVLYAETAQIFSETQETAEQTSVASTTAATTAVPTEEVLGEPQETCEVAANSAQTEEAPDTTAVLFSANESLWKVTECFSHASIEEQIGYEVDIDITQLYDYEAAVQYAQTLPEEMRQEAVAHNYSYVIINEIYLGSDHADWLCCAMYTLETGGLPSDGQYFSKLFYVKDGRVTEYLMQGRYDYCRLYYDYSGENIIIGTGNGIYSLPRAGGEPVKLIDTKYYCRLHYIAEEYLLYSDRDNAIEAYYFDTGENFTTNIYYGFQDAVDQSLDGDIITYWDTEMNGYRSFDILSREYSEASADEQEPKYRYVQAQDERYTASTDGQTVILRDRQTGEERRFSLDGLHTMHIDLLGFFGERLYLNCHSYGEGDHLIALDIATGKAQLFKPDYTSNVEYDFDPLTGAAVFYSEDNDMVGTAVMTDASADCFIGFAHEVLYNKDAVSDNGLRYDFAYVKPPQDPRYSTDYQGSSTNGNGGTEWSTVRKGDTFGRLSVTSAQCRYIEKGAPFQQEILLSGEITLSGRLIYNSEETILDFDVVFLPDIEDFKASGLPVTEEAKIVFSNGIRTACIDIAAFSLGAYSSHPQDFEGISFDENGTAEVTITLENLRYFYSYGDRTGTGFNSADIVSVTQN